MVISHHRLNGHESEQTLGDSEGQGSLVCCRLWGCKKLDMSECACVHEHTHTHTQTHTHTVWSSNTSFLKQENGGWKCSMTSDCEAGGHLRRGHPTWETRFSIADHLLSIAWPLFQNKSFPFLKGLVL